MLSITSINRGIVLDHISPGKGYKLFRLLELEKADFTVALIMNARSDKHGLKDLIKIENEIELDLRALGIIDENITINIIENEKIIRKIDVELPEEFEGVFKCKNPRCITTEERDIVNRFILMNKTEKKYRCAYCDHILSMED